MITIYHRPESLEEALDLLARPGLVLPLGGGSVLNAPHAVPFEVVDLQQLPLNDTALRGRFLEIGAGVRLQELAEIPQLQAEVREVLLKEATRNLRNQRTVAGTLIAADGRSPFACALLALDVQFSLLPGDQVVDYGQLLHMREGVGDGLPHLSGKLAARLTLHTEARLAYEYVARSPADRPVVAVAAAAWASGRLRVVVGGWGRVPRLAIDAPEPGGVEAAVRSATAEAGDAFATAPYRQDAAVTLARRAVDRLM